MFRKIISTLTVILLAVVFVHASESATARRYLVAFSASGPHGMPRYLMEIDQNGKILRAPKIITEPAGEGASTVGLFQLPGRNPVMWLRHRQSVLYALELDPRTWKVISRKQTSMQTFFSVDVGQGGASGFLTVGSPNGQTLAYAITPHGISTGKPLDLSAGTGKIGLFAGIAADGRAALYSSDPTTLKDPVKLLLRTMNAAGQLTGGPRVIAERGAEQDDSFLWPADVTNLLPGNKRLVAYVEVPNSEFVGTPLFIRSVPLDANQPLGPETLIDTTSIGSFQDVALDPQGSFLLYTTGKQLLIQHLNRDGAPSGNPSEIITGVDSPLQLDIVQQ